MYVYKNNKMDYKTTISIQIVNSCVRNVNISNSRTKLLSFDTPTSFNIYFLKLFDPV